MITVTLTVLSNPAEIIEVSFDPTMTVFQYFSELEKIFITENMAIPIALTVRESYLSKDQLLKPLSELQDDDPLNLKLQAHYEIKLIGGKDIEPYRLYPLPKLITVTLTISKKSHLITNTFLSTTTVRNCLLYFQNFCYDAGITIPPIYHDEKQFINCEQLSYTFSELYGDRPTLALTSSYHVIDNKNHCKLYPLPHAQFTLDQEMKFWNALKKPKINKKYLNRLLEKITEFKIASHFNTKSTEDRDGFFTVKLLPLYKARLPALINLLTGNR
jgi:hypothetical protein